MGDKTSLEFSFYGNFAGADPTPLLSVIQAQLLAPSATMTPMHDDFLFLTVGGGKTDLEVCFAAAFG